MAKHHCHITSCLQFYNIQTFNHIEDIHVFVLYTQSSDVICTTVSDDFFSVVRKNPDEILKNQRAIYRFLKIELGVGETILKLSGSKCILVHISIACIIL